MSKVDDLTIGEAKEIFKMFPRSESAHSPLIGEYVLVRTYSAGVHIGTLTNKDGTNVLLSNARRIWKWSDAFTLSEVATSGINKGGSRLSCAVPVIELTQAIEIIAVSKTAKEKFDEIHE